MRSATPSTIPAASTTPRPPAQLVTAQVRTAFKALAAGLVKQYGAYSPVPGYYINGELTLGENIGDNSGLSMTYNAYRRSLDGKPSPVIDGLTGEQRLYIGFALKWRAKLRPEAAIAQIKSDPHSPGEFRAKGTVMNQPGFYEAFGIKPGDADVSAARAARDHVVME